MKKVSEERMKLRIEYSRKTDLIFSDNIPAYADWLENKLSLKQIKVIRSKYSLEDLYKYVEELSSRVDKHIHRCKLEDIRKIIKTHIKIHIKSKLYCDTCGSTDVIDSVFGRNCNRCNPL